MDRLAEDEDLALTHSAGAGKMAKTACPVAGLPVRLRFSPLLWLTGDSAAGSGDNFDETWTCRSAISVIDNNRGPPGSSGFAAAAAIIVPGWRNRK